MTLWYGVIARTREAYDSVGIIGSNGVSIVFVGSQEACEQRCNELRERQREIRATIPIRGDEGLMAYEIGELNTTYSVSRVEVSLPARVRY